MAYFKISRVRRFTKVMQQAARLAGNPLAALGMAPAPAPNARRPSARGVAAASAPSPIGAGSDTFTRGNFSYRREPHGYKVYVPPGLAGTAPAGLLVMLHGCKQDPDDFAHGTGVNALAREAGWVVLYPAQDGAANRNRCWNWFGPGTRQRGTGEPAWIAALTRAAMRQFKVRSKRVFVAGLSAGGAMAATLAHLYPETYAACAVHSGLAAGAAHGVIDALSVMRSGSDLSASTGARLVPTIVFHGDHDKTVHPRHGLNVLAAALRPLGGGTALSRLDGTYDTEEGVTVGGRRFSRRIYRGAGGRPIAEYWDIHGMGHAWSGGHTGGSYVDPAGPDAAKAMMHFFAAASPR